MISRSNEAKFLQQTDTNVIMFIYDNFWQLSIRHDRLTDVLIQKGCKASLSVILQNKEMSKSCIAVLHTPTNWLIRAIVSEDSNTVKVANQAFEK